MVLERFKNAWSAFRGTRDPTQNDLFWGGYGSSYPISKNRLLPGNERSIVTSIYNQIAVDCASIDILHVRLNDEGMYDETIDDSLNYALSKSANIDQTARDFFRDAVISMLDEGVVALIPVLTDVDPRKTESFNVYEIRTGKILEWYPREVLVEVYDDLIGQKKQIKVEKRYTPIIENPFYSVMNEPNSTLRRLIRVLNDSDQLNSDMVSNMDIIIQLPFMTRSEARQLQAEQRRKKLESQLSGGAKYGIGYIDAAEKIIQLNRPLENNLWKQAQELQNQLFNQLGMSKTIFDGTADEATMLNYQNRTIEPILSSFTEEMERKWISRTGISQKQAIRFYKDPFKLVPVSQIAEISDKFTRNCIMTSNEIRAVIGRRPVDDPKANKLINNNLNQPEEKQQDSKSIDISETIEETT